MISRAVRLLPQVRDALASGAPIVALESSVLAQGLPIPANEEAARRTTAAVASAGALPAVTAVVRGEPTLGITDAELARFLRREGVSKVSARDLAFAMLRGTDGATTVAATLAICAAAGARVFATGGIGGVHRESPGADASEQLRDESADLAELARTPAVVVCAGAKSILDLPGTVERLETLGVAIVGWRTRELPGFFTAETGISLHATVETEEEVARLFLHERALGRPGALLVVQAPPADLAMPRREVDDAVRDALAAARRESVRGAAVTPWLLAAVERATGGRSLAINLALLEANASLAARIAVALSAA